MEKLVEWIARGRRFAGSQKLDRLIHWRAGVGRKLGADAPYFLKLADRAVGLVPAAERLDELDPRGEIRRAERGDVAKLAEIPIGGSGVPLVELREGVGDVCVARVGPPQRIEERSGVGGATGRRV